MFCDEAKLARCVVFWTFDLRMIYLCHDRAGTDGSALADYTVGLDDGSSTNVHLIFDDDGTSSYSRLAAFSRGRVTVGYVAAEVDVLADLYSASDDDVARVFDVAIRANIGVVADADVVAVVAGERVVDDDSGADAAWTGLGVVVIAILMIRVGPLERVEDTLEETAFLLVASPARVIVGFVPAFDGCFARPAVFDQVFVDVGPVRLADQHPVLF